MPEVSGNQALIVVALLVLALLVAWWIFRRRPERVRAETPDVLTPGAAPAERNTLLVDAPSAVAPPAGAIVGGIGEVVSAAAAAEAEAARPAPPPIAVAAGEPDDLTRLKGVGPKLQAMLRDLGVTRFDQIAAWTPADIAAIDPHLGAFQGRIVRDGWTEQARYLASGDVAGFEARFGKV
ncbi:MAG: hypothetical protein LC648_04065 [Novosphingobium sp.]|nr:hypothetical protein [Novosphingobium sp.]